MKQRIALAVAAALVVGCGPLKAAVNSSGPRTNERVMEATVDGLSISSVIKPIIRPGSAIAVRNIEAEKTTDKKLVALIEDQMVIDLLANGFTVLERDNNAIRRVIEEGGRNKYSIIRGEMEFMDQLVHLEESGDRKLVVKPAKVEDNKKHLLLTHLKAADYVLSYRVQQLGINYTPVGMKDMKRNAVARVHVRVEEVSSGKIVLARNIENISNDTIRNDQMKSLAFNARSQFYHAYPGQSPDEDNLYVLSDKHPYAQMALLNSFTDQANGFSIKSPIQVGLIYGENGSQHIAYETLSGEIEHTSGGITVSMQQDASLLVYGTRTGEFELGSIRTAIVPEIGIGNGALTNWNDNRAEQKKGIAFKVGVGLESQAFSKVDIRVGADYYQVESNFLILGAMAVRYRF